MVISAVKRGILREPLLIRRAVSCTRATVKPQIPQLTTTQYSRRTNGLGPYSFLRRNSISVRLKWWCIHVCRYVAVGPGHASCRVSEGSRTAPSVLHASSGMSKMSRHFGNCER